MSSAAELLTPDFIQHAWRPLHTATLKDNFVHLTWADGTRLQAYSLWLRENCAAVGIEPQIREGVIDPADLPDPEVLRSVSIGATGALELIWSDTNPSNIHPGWLYFVAQGHLSVQHGLPTQTAWDAASVPHPPTLNGTRILEDLDLQQTWLGQLVEFGVCRLSNTPAKEDYLEHLMAHIGPIRSSNFGGTFHVRLSPTPDSTANTGLKLGQHSDLPTRETPPGYQFLHCIENTVGGGASRLTDGLALVSILQREQPAAFDILTTAQWLFMNRSPTAEHCWQGPIIELPAAGRPLTLRAFYPVRSAPLMEPDKVPAAYAALKIFSQYAQDPRLMLQFTLQPGDLLGFDNRRILHGREAFATEGTRHLTGCYIDHDEIYSRLRVLKRPAWNNTHAE